MHTIRWYCRYSLSYRDPQKLMAERGVEVDYLTISRWIQNYAPELVRHIPPYLVATIDYMDEIVRCEYPSQL